MKNKAAMIKASNPVVKDGLGILARLVVIAMLLSFLSAMLQGCTGREMAGKCIETESLGNHFQEVNEAVQDQTKIFWKVS